jgi:two-component system sensor histidine kinase UhpB
MKKIFLILSYSAVLSICPAQHRGKIDSLLNLLKTPIADTTQTYILNELGNLYRKTGDYGRAIQYSKDALRISEKISFRKGIANSYSSIGIILNEEGNYSDALINHIASLKIRINIQDKPGILSSYFNTAVTYERQGNYSDAMKNVLIALSISEQIKDEKSRAYCLNEIGILYQNQGQYSEAMKYQLASLKIKEEIADERGKSIAYSNIGEIFRLQGNYSEALKNQLASLHIDEELGDKAGIAVAYNNIGDIYSLKHDFQNALKSHFAALKIRNEIGDKQGIAASYGNIGGIYGEKGNYSKSLENLFAALKIQKEIGDKQNLALSYANIGQIYLKQKKYTEARKYLNDALSLSKVLAFKEGIMGVYDDLMELESAVGNYRQSLVQYKLSVRYKDSLLNESSNKQIAEMKTKYETEKKDKEILTLTKDRELQNAEIKKQTLLKNSLVGGLLLFSILSFFVYRTYSTRQKLKLQVLRNKIASDLHDDVGSTLSSIAIFSEVARQQSKEVIPMLDTIGENATKMLDAMADIVWTINPENDQFEKLILRMRSFAYELLGARKIDFEFAAEEDVTKMKLPMDVRRNLYLIFKEATNNMVKYSEADKALFSMYGTNGKLRMVIRDNGKGFNVHNLSEGNGLKNMKRRAEEIGAQLHIESFPGSGTSIHLLFTVA